MWNAETPCDYRRNRLFVLRLFNRLLLYKKVKTKFIVDDVWRRSFESEAWINTTAKHSGSKISLHKNISLMQNFKLFKNIKKIIKKRTFSLIINWFSDSNCWRNMCFTFNLLFHLLSFFKRFPGVFTIHCLQSMLKYWMFMLDQTP
jgi:hypothetical protein